MSLFSLAVSVRVYAADDRQVSAAARFLSRVLSSPGHRLIPFTVS
jgi:hypothetical protein